MYTKLASSLLTSTVWMEDDHTVRVWVTLLAMKDRHGEVMASIPGLANIARVPVESCRAAIAKFLAPDPDSRTKTLDGRRIQEIEGGWLIVNHEKYRNLDSDDDRREKAAIRVKRHRERKESGVTERYKALHGVTERYMSHQISHTDTDTDTDANASTQERESRAREEIKEPENVNEYFRAGKVPGTKLEPGQEKEMARRFGCRFPSDGDVSLFCAKAGIEENFAKNWIREMDENTILHAAFPERRMVDGEHHPITNWRWPLKAAWDASRRDKRANAWSGRSGRSGGQPVPLERDFFAECREAVKHPDVVPDWDVEKELPECVWAMFKGCLQASLTDREVYRRHLRAAQSRGEDFSKQMETLRDECKREWRGSFEKRWAEFMSRGNPFEKK